MGNKTYLVATDVAQWVSNNPAYTSPWVQTTSLCKKQNKIRLQPMQFQPLSQCKVGGPSDRFTVKKKQTKRCPTNSLWT